MTPEQFNALADERERRIAVIAQMAATLKAAELGIDSHRPAREYADLAATLYDAVDAKVAR